MLADLELSPDDVAAEHDFDFHYESGVVDDGQDLGPGYTIRS